MISLILYYQQRTTAGLSSGVLFLLLMLSEHAEFGFERNSNYRRVTVGQMLAVHVPRSG
jgi:hypothetical protein